MIKQTQLVLAGALMVAAGGAVADGKATYDAKCIACHNTASAIPNVPILGNKAAWAPRIATGIDALTASVKSGKGAMPPKGTCMECSDAELKAAVEYMVSQSQ